MKGGTKWDESRGCGRHVDVQGEDNERIVESVFVDSVADFLIDCIVREAFSRLEWGFFTGWTELEILMIINERKLVCCRANSLYNSVDSRIY